MEIICHRGYWKSNSEKNNKIAFERSFNMLLGTETDIRDYNSQLVISHDIPNNNSISVASFFEYYKEKKCFGTLALNIKCDGLQILLLELIKKYQISNYFVFDMSIPDMFKYKELGIRFFSRQSEVELQPILLDHCSGIWLDAFDNIWYDACLIRNHLDNGLDVAIVSPELHGRDYISLWNLIKSNGLHNYENIILCTDLPELALNFFK